MRKRRRFKVDYSQLDEYISSAPGSITTEDAIMKVPLFRDTLKVFPSVYKSYVRKMKKLGYSLDDVIPLSAFENMIKTYAGERVRKHLLRKGLTNTAQVEDFQMGEWNYTADDYSIRLERLNKDIQKIKKEIEWFKFHNLISDREMQHLYGLLDNGLDFAVGIVVERLESLRREKRVAARKAAQVVA